MAECENENSNNKKLEWKKVEREDTNTHTHDTANVVERKPYRVKKTISIISYLFSWHLKMAKNSQIPGTHMRAGRERELNSGQQILDLNHLYCHLFWFNNWGSNVTDH